MQSAVLTATTLPGVFLQQRIAFAEHAASPFGGDAGGRVDLFQRGELREVRRNIGQARAEPVDQPREGRRVRVTR